MKNTTIKLGLALAGGGAKGAYQSGVVKYLAEIDFSPMLQLARALVRSMVQSLPLIHRLNNQARSPMATMERTR